MQAIKKALSGDSDKHNSSHSATSNAYTSPQSASVKSDAVAESRDIGSTPAAAGTTNNVSRTGVTGGAAATRVPDSSYGADKHIIGHDTSSRASNDFDARDPSTTHSHTHLGHKTHETHHHHEIEEVERLKNHDRHITHVQHHVQPVLDEEHKPEVHHHVTHPQTHIEERHVSSEADKRAFAGLSTHSDTVTHAGKERAVVDLGEKVTESVHHHVHNVIQPVVHKDTHEHHRIHTTIPSHHVTHEAPIVHQSVEHAPLPMSDFVKQGGVLGAKETHDTVPVLAEGDCERRVDGVGEDLARKLHLSGTTGTTTGTTSGVATGMPATSTAGAI